MVVVGGTQLGVALAQPTPGQGASEPELRQQRVANLSGADQLREANNIVDRMTQMRRRVSDMLDRARQDRDIIRVNCLNDKLTQLDVTLRSAREHRELLQTAVSINNDGQRNHEFTLLTIFRSRAENLETEAHTCVGEETGTFDRARFTLRLTVDPNIPEGDTTEYPTAEILPDRPLVTSPVM